MGEYLAAQSEGALPEPEEEEEASMFGLYGSRKETLFWTPEFFALCFDDLKETTWPSSKSVLQTVVTSQIAFIIIFIVILLFDATAEAAVRSLIQGKEFVLTLDGSASPSRGI